jgi:hypothetical protein
MPTSERVTVTLPAGLVRAVDRLEKNRSTFLQEAARRQLERRRTLLERSLRSPHPETAELAEAGFQNWASSLPQEEDTAGLVDLRAGREVR